MKNIPLYIKVDHYEEVQDLLTMIKKKIDGAKHLLQEIQTMKTEEDAKIKQWEEHLLDVEQKLQGVEKQFS